MARLASGLETTTRGYMAVAVGNGCPPVVAAVLNRHPSCGHNALFHTSLNCDGTILWYPVSELAPARADAPCFSPEQADGTGSCCPRTQGVGALDVCRRLVPQPSIRGHAKFGGNRHGTACRGGHGLLHPTPPRIVANGICRETLCEHQNCNSAAIMRRGCRPFAPAAAGVW